MSDLTPIRPTLRRSSTPAMPPTTVTKMIGPTTIVIIEMNTVPRGSRSVPTLGQAAPTATPATIPTSTQTYSCRYHRDPALTAVLVAALAAMRKLPTPMGHHTVTDLQTIAEGDPAGQHYAHYAHRPAASGQRSRRMRHCADARDCASRACSAAAPPDRAP